MQMTSLVHPSDGRKRHTAVMLVAPTRTEYASLESGSAPLCQTESSLARLLARPSKNYSSSSVKLGLHEHIIHFPYLTWQGGIEDLLQKPVRRVRVTKAGRCLIELPGFSKLELTVTVSHLADAKADQLSDPLNWKCHSCTQI